MKTETLIVYGLVGALAYLAWKKLSQAKAPAAPAAAPLPPGAFAPGGFAPPVLRTFPVDVPGQTVFDLANPALQYQLDEIAFSP